MRLVSHAKGDALIKILSARHWLAVPAVLAVPGTRDASLPNERERQRDLALFKQRTRALETEVAALRRCEQLLEETLHTRDEYLSAVTHDLKTPLTSIRAGVQLLLRLAARGTLQPEQLVNSLTVVNQGATRLTSMLDQLVDIARIRGGHPPALELRQTDLVALAERLAVEHQHATTRHTIIVVAGESELLGNWDQGRLERVIDNLLDNARKYSPDGGEITLRLGREDERTAFLSVRDEGIGIPACDVAQIFDQYHRASNVGSRSVGSGIGLASARQVVALHGGTIKVESQEGHGSTFTVRLPIAGPLGSSTRVDQSDIAAQN